MASEAQLRANKNYLSKMKTWTIRARPEEAQKIEQAAAAAGQSVQGYILEAVRRRMAQEQASTAEVPAGGNIHFSDIPNEGKKGK